MERTALLSYADARPLVGRKTSASRTDTLMIRFLIKPIAWLVALGAATAAAFLAYSSYRDRNVSRIFVSNLSDLGSEFEIAHAALRVRDPDVLKICFAGDYVYALKDARYWFAADDTEFALALGAAGGRADIFNGEERSSIVLLSHKSAVIMQLDRRTGLSVANFGCADADAGNIVIRRYLTNPSIELLLSSATLKAPVGPDQPPATPCVGQLRRFSDSIDELLAENVVEEEFFWAVIRKYLPAKGCAAPEVISITRTSRFFVPLGEPGPHANYRIAFKNADTLVSFGLQRDTGNIEFPFVGPTRAPTPSF